MASTSAPSVSVVVATWNNAGTIAACVDALLALRLPEGGLECIVVNDGSTDGTTARLPAEGIRLIDRPHAGRAAALNAGWRAARGDLVFFTDADCVVPADWIEGHLRCYREDPGLDGVGGLQVPARPTLPEILKMAWYEDEYRNGFPIEGTYDGRCLNGNNMSMRRAALDRVGGFDEGFLQGADQDLTRRLVASGSRLSRIVASRVTHLRVEGVVAFLQSRYRRGSAAYALITAGASRAGVLLRSLLPPLRGTVRAAIAGRRLAGGGLALAFGLALLSLAAHYATAVGRFRYLLGPGGPGRRVTA